MKAIPLPEVSASDVGLAGICVFLIVILLARLRNRKTGHTALYLAAVYVQRWLWLCAAIPPTLARFSESLPDALRAAWQIERPRAFTGCREEEEDRAVRRARGLRKVVGI